MWTFALPGLRDRREDIEPNIDYELAKFCQEQQSQIRFDSEARNVYVKFACSSQALWRGNFVSWVHPLAGWQRLPNAGVLLKRWRRRNWPFASPMAVKINQYITKANW